MKNILIVYPVEPWTTGFYCERALKEKYFTEIFDLKKTPNYAWWAVRLGNILISTGKPLSVSEVIKNLEKKPDLIIEIDGRGLYHLTGYKELGIPVAYWAIDSHIHAKYNFQKKIAIDFSYIFVAQKEYVDDFKKNNKNSFWLPLAADPEIHKPYLTEKKFDIGFVGAKNPKTHPERTKLLNCLEAKYNLVINSNAYGGEMAKIYSSSKIGFNKSLRGDLNMRVFEIMSCGTMLLTDRISNGLNGLFEDKKHLVLYNNLRDLDEKIQYYLEKKEEREFIATEGQKEIWQKHTYKNRMDEMIESIFRK